MLKALQKEMIQDSEVQDVAGGQEESKRGVADRTKAPSGKLTKREIEDNFKVKLKAFKEKYVG